MAVLSFTTHIGLCLSILSKLTGSGAEKVTKARHCTRHDCPTCCTHQLGYTSNQAQSREWLRRRTWICPFPSLPSLSRVWTNSDSQRCNDTTRVSSPTLHNSQLINDSSVGNPESDCEDVPEWQGSPWIWPKLSSFVMADVYTHMCAHTYIVLGH